MSYCNIICPKCKSSLVKEEKRYVCKNNHSYDIAKQGYTNLVLNYKDTMGDNKELVDARSTFLNYNYYEFLRSFLIDIIDSLPNETIIDCGCGEGYYTNEIAKTYENVIGIDLSKYALLKATKAQKAHYFINSINEICVEDNSVDIILSIFSYRNYKEFQRILKAEGYYIEVLPAENHLIELKEVLYDHAYLNNTKVEQEYFTLIDRFEIKQKQILNQEQLQALFHMTPYFYKTSLKDKEKLTTITELECTFAFIVNIYERR